MRNLEKYCILRGASLASHLKMKLGKVPQRVTMVPPLRVTFRIKYIPPQYVHIPTHFSNFEGGIIFFIQCFLVDGGKQNFKRTIQNLMLLINLFQFVYKQDQTGSKRFFNPFKYIFSKKCGKQHTCVVNMYPILGCDITLHPKHPIWGVDGVFNPYLHILNIFSPNIIELLLSNSTTFQNQTQSSSNTQHNYINTKVNDDTRTNRL